ncbi:MAG: prepilin-type N-terminal cleavage/methylation domain-containing protein [Planctomycetes bacterium]|nr:prepilin-type N-terminal cleavage/methylation domain-containing protein [Planctomycetota bacterium]
MIRPSLRRLRAFTLIELVVVLAVLVILAGGIVAKLDVLQLRANKGVAGSDISGVARLMQTYVVANNHYPDGYDSLINVGSTPSLWASLDPQTTGLPLGSGNPTKLAVGTLTANEFRSLNRMGITTLHDVNTDVSTPAGFPSDAFSIPRQISATVAYGGGTPTGPHVAILNATLNGSASNDADAQAVMEHFYPQTNGDPGAGRRVVVFGLGQRCTLIGRSGMSLEAPLYANNPDRSTYYGRYLVAFEVSSSGSRARLLGALGGDGDRLDEEVVGFYETQ